MQINLVDPRISSVKLPCSQRGKSGLTNTQLSGDNDEYEVARTRNGRSFPSLLVRTTEVLVARMQTSIRSGPTLTSPTGQTVLNQIRKKVSSAWIDDYVSRLGRNEG